jgi:disulfide bond formation protein DsbB
VTPLNRTLDALALLGLSAILLVAFYYQFARGELPCPLCALQRVGFIVAGTGLILNIRVGYSPAHYALILLTSVVAAATSLRQIALHVVPGTGSYGSALFGIHFYTWAFVGYGMLVVFVAVMLLLAARTPAHERANRDTSPWINAACWLFILIAAANVVAFVLECGVGPCPDTPLGYLWWPSAK